MKMSIKKPTPKEYLESNITDYALDDFGIILLSDDYEDFYISLGLDYFSKDLYDFSKGTLDPTEVISVGKYNINELESMDRYYYDEWDLSEVCDVFFKNIKKASVDFA
tara:strand:+ start:289 stop:612 length:324 start_codon:yes stop_codon:yes gene_type:complete